MGLTGLHTNWMDGSYTNDRDREVKISENNPLYDSRNNPPYKNLNAHVDIKGNSIAVGYGYDLKQNLSTLKTDLADYVTASSNLDMVYQLVDKYFNQGNPENLNLGGLATAINQYFDFSTEAKASALLTQTINKVEAQLDARLGYSMAQSRERAALISIAYNGMGLLEGGTPDQSIIDAIVNDDRIRAWYLIRYRRNGGNSRSQGIANRRYRESDLFGLWDNGGPTTTELEDFETFLKQMDTYTTNISTLQLMRNYEAQYTPKTTEANNSRTIDEQINNEPAVRNYFISKYGQGQNINGNIIIGTELSNKIITTTGTFNSSAVKAGYLKSTDESDLILGEKGADLIDGANGNDVIYGGEGNDQIIGGTGNDILEGGAGDDRYYFQSGDGSDKINDNEGKNQIIWEDSNGDLHVEKTFYKTAEAQWKSADGTTEVNQNSPYKMVFPDGTTVELGESISSFDVTLKDVPENPITTNTITGDHNQDKNDNLNDTSANDRIEGLDGEDFITAWSGGNDVLLGGSGNDGIAAGSGDDIVEGNAGSDILLGEEGSDKVFGQNYGEMETLIANGENAENINAKGDLATGSAGDDFVYGSNSKDLLFGGAGHDLIVGGGGDDAILGDFDFSSAYLDWSFSKDGNIITINNVSVYDPGFKGNDVIYAGSGNDHISGNRGNDEIDAGAGNDVVYGGAGDDSISGGAGDDYLVGDEASAFVPAGEEGNNFIDGGDGSDQIWGGYKADVLFGGDGNDWIQGDYDAQAGDDDYMDGETGDDTIIGMAGNDTIFGGEGNDNLHGDASNVPIGSQGDDYIDGETGDDIILGYGGNDTLIGSEGNDTLYGGAGDDYLYGGEDDDNLYGDDGDDYLDGGEGNDQLYSGEGNDTYIFGRGSGQDVIFDYDVNVDTIQMASDIAPSDITVQHAENNLVLSITDTGDKLTVLNWFLNDSSEYHVEQIQFSEGTVWDAEAIKQATLQGTEGDDTLIGYSTSDTLYGGSGNDMLYGDAGDDTLDGGTGDDTLYGNTGNDTYIFGRGSGKDTIIDIDTTAGNIDTIVLGADIAPADISIKRTGNDLLLSIKGTSDTLTVKDWFLNEDPQYQVENIQFADGTIWDVDIIKQSVLQGTAGDDNLSGYSTSDTLRGESGNDVLDGGGGDDTLYGGEGNDVINGGVGDDTLYGDKGNDVLNGWLGADTLYGGEGNDVLNGEAGGDIMIGGSGDDLYYIEQSGDIVIEDGGEGNDTVNSSISYTLAANVENLNLLWTGIYDPNINGTGNELNNILVGNRGDNILHGGAGDDILYGGGKCNAVWYSEMLYGDEGNDRLISDGPDLLYGGEGDDILEGLGPQAFLYGEAGNDTLYGGEYESFLDGGTGTDIMAGSQGDDYYWVDNVGDVVIENAGEGKDTVESSITYILPANVENLSLTGTANINGTGNELDNRLYGNSGNNILEGGAGDDDYIHGGAGDDYIDGGAGNDTLLGGEGNDILYGGEGNDLLDGHSGTDVMAGGKGDDLYRADDINDAITELTNEGIDTVGSFVTYTLGTNVENLQLWWVANTNPHINGTGNELNNNLYGTIGNNILNGKAGNDYLNGGSGNDTYVFGRGDGHDTVYDWDQTAGNIDVIQFVSDITTSDITVQHVGNDLIISVKNTEDSITVKNWFLNESTEYQIEQFQFSDGTVWDVNAIKQAMLQGTEGDDLIMGNAGDNLINGEAGNDILYGADGNDVINGGIGNDYIDGKSGNDILNGGEGNDYVYGYFGNDLINGDAGDDILYGGPDNDVINGGIGNDYIEGESGDDTLTGGEGNDYVYGYFGNDTINGEAGDDILYGGPDNDIINGGIGNDYLEGEAGDDQLSGGEGNDYVYGYFGNDTINGDTGDDILYGGPDNDIITGGIGNDYLEGESGDDVLTGGTGNDYLAGYTGNDTYIFNNGDGIDAISDCDTTTGNTDTVQFQTNPLDLIFTQLGNDLNIITNSTNDQVTIQNWYTDSAYQTEEIKTGDNKCLLNTQVAQLIQAMASFCTTNGVTWNQAIEQKPAEVQQVLAQYWSQS